MEGALALSRAPLASCGIALQVASCARTNRSERGSDQWSGSRSCCAVQRRGRWHIKMAASPSHHTSCPRPFQKRRKVQQAHPSTRLFSSPTADRGSQLSWQLGHVSWQHSLGEATYTLVGANAPTTKTKFSINYLTFTTCAPPSINDHAPHEPTWKRESSDQWQASNYCLFADYLHHRDSTKLVSRFVLCSGYS